jgi:hypothetical protein
MVISEDFKLGWLIHCRYDQIKNELQQTLPIPLDIISEDHWILYSALKVIQDMNDVWFTVNVNLKQSLSVYCETFGIIPRSKLQVSLLITAFYLPGLVDCVAITFTRRNGTPLCHIEELATRDLIEIEKISHFVRNDKF